MNSSLAALNALNFFMADVQAGLGPFLGVFLQARHWSPAQIGLVMTIGGIAGHGRHGAARRICRCDCGQALDRRRDGADYCAGLDGNFAVAEFRRRDRGTDCYRHRRRRRRTGNRRDHARAGAAAGLCPSAWTQRSIQSFRQCRRRAARRHQRLFLRAWRGVCHSRSHGGVFQCSDAGHRCPPDRSPGGARRSGRRRRGSEIQRAPAVEGTDGARRYADAVSSRQCGDVAASRPGDGCNTTAPIPAPRLLRPS